MTNLGAQASRIKSTRDISLDGVKVIAILLVITIHLSAKGFSFMTEHWWAVNIYESISRVGVPLFLMVTGALLLPRTPDARSMMRRALRVGLPLAVWSVVYLCWFQYTGTLIDNWFASILRAPVVPHLWYLYILIGAYIFLPVLAGFYQLPNVSAQVLALLAWFIGSSLAPLAYALTSRVYVGLDWSFLSLYAGYMVLGAMLFHKLPAQWLKLWPAIVMWSVSTAGIAYFTWWHSLVVGRAVETFYTYSSPLVITAAIGAFCGIRVFFSTYVQGSTLLSRWTFKLAKLSFGIYLVHVLVMFWLDLNGISYNFINPWMGIPIATMAVLAGSTAITMLLEKIPYVRAIVPG